MFLILQEREEQSESCCWKGSLIAEHQPLLSLVSSSSSGSSNSSALLSYPCPSPLIQLQMSEHGGCLRREGRDGCAVCLAEGRNVAGGNEGEMFCSEYTYFHMSVFVKGMGLGSRGHGVYVGIGAGFLPYEYWMSRMWVVHVVWVMNLCLALLCYRMVSQG